MDNRCHIHLPPLNPHSKNYDYRLFLYAAVFICIYITGSIFVPISLITNGVNNCFLFAELHVMMMKNEQVAGCTGAAVVLQHAKGALLVCVLDAKSVVSQIAAARLALTLLGTRRLESPKH